MIEPLRPTAFRGDPDVDDLHRFFGPAGQYDGHTRWTFGSSLKSGYVNSFEFMNHAPTVQLWRDAAGTIQAVSRLLLGTAEWLHQAAPSYRNAEVTGALIQQADAAFRLLSDHPTWSTVRYESDTAEIELLQESGYAADGVAEVYMTQPLSRAVESTELADGLELQILDRNDTSLVNERAMAQVDAFTPGEPTDRELAWIGRTIRHQLDYGRPHAEPCVIAIDTAGSVLAFADVFFDRTNLIGEFEPVGTRKSARRRGLAKAATIRGLQEMQDAEMQLAVVRTEASNSAAIATYESAGFEITDHLIRFRTNQ